VYFQKNLTKFLGYSSLRFFRQMIIYFEAQKKPLYVITFGQGNSSDNNNQII